MSSEDVEKRLKKIGEFNPDDSELEAVTKLKKYERTIHLAYWRDASCVANHGHVLMTVKPTFDPAVYLCPSETTSAFKDIPTIVERPQLYLLARCSSSDAEQLTYMETRLEDTVELKISDIQTNKGIKVQFIMRMFIGDGPAQHFETGESSGGHNGCSGCASDARRFWDLAYTFWAKHLTLKDRKDIVLAGPAGRQRRNGGIHPFDKLKKEEILDELITRKVKGNIMNLKKNDLEKILKEDVLMGVARLPSPFFSNQDATLSDLGLEKYEVAPIEPLHDLKDHIKNLLEGLPRHLSGKEISSNHVCQPSQNLAV